VSLRQYRQKRQFERTPEPRGDTESGRGPLRFVVQKHQASRLHYDFRLELDGTLKSWAVPKGPSLNPADKRLAVMVEDHPLDYRTFEGTIPKGNYGAGTVMVWDQGTYCSRQSADRVESERLLREGLLKGQITFVLNGEKLQGEFALIRVKQGKNNWLLVKKRDSFASSDNVLDSDRSVASGRGLDEIAQGVAPVRTTRKSRKRAPTAPKSDPQSQVSHLPPSAAAGGSAAPRGDQQRQVSILPPSAGGEGSGVRGGQRTHRNPGFREGF
jgi:bifunctional non-homologous end joining protein LigD